MYFTLTKLFDWEMEPLKQLQIFLEFMSNGEKYKHKVSRLIVGEGVLQNILLVFRFFVFSFRR